MKRTLLSNLGARAVTTPLSAICSFIGASLSIHYLGGPLYAAVILITGLAQLLPFADLGVGAAVINALSANGHRRANREEFTILVSAQRVLTGGGVIIIAGCLAIAALHLWQPLLGSGLTALAPHGDLAVVAFGGVFAAFIFSQLGYRILTGLGLNPLVTFLGAFGSILSLTLIWIGTRLNQPALWFILAPTASSFFCATAACIIGCRYAHVRYRDLLAAIPQTRRFPHRSLRATAFPMLIILVALPMVVFSDRIVLSHVSTAHALIEYTVASQVYAPMWGAATGSLIALWPLFTKARTGDAQRGFADLRSAVVTLSILGALGGTGLCAGLPLVTNLISGGTAVSSWGLSAAFGSLILVQVAFYPIGVFMTQPLELRFQAACVIAMFIVAIPLSVVSASIWGAPGPVFVTTGSIILFQMLPAWLYLRKRAKIPA